MAILVILCIFLLFAEISSKHSGNFNRAVETFKTGSLRSVSMSKHDGRWHWRGHKYANTAAPIRILNDWLVVGAEEPRMKFFINTNVKPFLMVKK